MVAYLRQLSAQPIAVLAAGAALAIALVLAMFPAQGLEIDAQASHLCPAGHLAADPAQFERRLAAGFARVNGNDGERVCVPLDQVQSLAFQRG